MTLAVSLACSSFARSLRFYTDVLGFTTMRFQPDKRRADVERDAVAIEIVEVAGSPVDRLEYPFGRGVTLIVWSNDVEAVYAGVQAYGARLHQPLHEVWREEEGTRTGHAEFEVLDPDGYALKFCQAFPPAPFVPGRR
jgi:catechol 2,3-dioxygenase-like lactoylglutathione lyase family enzyme